MIGLPLGIYAATHRGSLIDNVLAFVSVAFIAVPSFVVAIFLLLIFAIWLDWLPVLGTSRSGDFFDEFKRMILPTLALAAGWIGSIARLVRASMLEVMGEPYIRTARACGLPERLVTYKYASRTPAFRRSRSSGSASVGCSAARCWWRSSSRGRGSVG